MMPPVIGSISRPELAADSPELICRNVGMKAIAENMPRPTARPSAVATTKVRLRNSDIGMIGSTARRSITTKAIAETTNSGEHRERPRRAPAVAAAEVGEQDQRRRGGRERDDAGVVQRRACCACAAGSGRTSRS